MRKGLGFVMISIVGLTLVEVNAATGLQSSQGTGRGSGGRENCQGRCADHYAECQRRAPEGSPERSLCEQRFARCAQWCEVVYGDPLATDAAEADVGDVLAGVGDVNGDGVLDIAVADPTQGEVLIFSGADGTLLSSLNTPDLQAEMIFRAPLSPVGDVEGDTVVGDVNGDGVLDIAVADPTQGEVLIFSGADGTLLSTLALPSRRVEPDVGRSGTEGQALFIGESCDLFSPYVKEGKWRTLESCWSCSEIVAFFVAPEGAQIKVRKGVGWLGWDSQKQTLDGVTTKSLTMKGIVYQRMQIKVPESTYVTYTRCAVGPEPLPE